MDGTVPPGSAQAGPCLDGTAQWSDTTRPDLALGSALHHKLSLATTRSTGSASSSSHRSYPVASSSALNRPPYQPLHSESLPSQQNRSRDQAKRLPVYVRIVPKDIWLRIHINPSQSIGSIKDTALLKANAPEHDPSLSYRFYRDALNASAHAKLAPVASHDKVVKHRSYALPRTFLCPLPDLSDVTASLVAWMANARRSTKPLRGVQSAASSIAAPSSVPPLPTFDSAYSPRQVQRAAGPSTSQQLHRAPSQAQMSQDASASPGSRSRPLPLSRALGGSSSSARSASDDAMGSSSAHVSRQISSSTLATSPPSTPSDFAHNIASVPSDASQSGTSHSHSHFHAANEIAIRLDASLITGNRDAKLEEDQARLRLSQWNAHRASSGAPVAQQAGPSSPTQQEISPPSTLSPSQSINSTPTIGSSSNFDSEAGSSPNMASSSGLNAPFGTNATSDTTSGSGQMDRLHSTATPPRRPARSEQRLAPTTAAFYSQPGASESFNSLASISSPSSSELVTTADDDAAVMQWGTQAEADVPLSDQPSPCRTRSSAAISPLSSPLQPSAPTASTAASLSTASSPVRPRSRTVTAADVLRSRAAKDEPPPPMPDVVSSPVRKSSLPKVQGIKMVAESSQRRAVPDDLMELLKGSPKDQDEAFSTVQQRRARGSKEALTLRKMSSDGSAAGAMGGLSSPSSAPSITAGTGAATGEERDRYLAGIRLDEISRGFKDASHPLSSKFAVLSSANGCELEEWKTVAAYQIRAYELLELQWSIPTERVYIPPVNLQDTILRVPANGGSGKDMFKQTWGEDMDAGPDAEALCLEPYFEGWVYVLKGGVTLGRTDKTSKSSSKPGKWKLHWITVKGWRIDLYRKKPRAGEAVLPVAEQTWPLRTIDWVIESENPIPTNAALPALDTLPLCSITVAFSPRGGGGGGGGATSSLLSSPGSFASSSATSGEVSTLTFRCISRFDHEAISTLLLRAWYRSSTTSAGVDDWRRKAVFRALVAGRGGTVAAGRVGRGRGGRNAKARIRLRPSGWAKEWEDADQWSSESEREEMSPPAELEESLQQRRDTMTQVKADRGKKQEVDERMIVPNGLYAALLGRTAGSSATCAAGAGSEGEVVSSRGGANTWMMDSSPYHQGSVSSSGGRRSLVQSPSLPHMEPGLMLGSNAFDRRLVHPTKPGVDDGSSKSKSRQRSGSLSRSPDPTASDSNTSWRSRSLTVSSPSGTCRGRSNVNSANSSRNVSRQASPLPSSTSARKASGAGSGGGGYAMSPALAPGFIDVPPPPSLLLLRKYKASQKANSNPTS